MTLNKSAQEFFDGTLIESIAPDDAFPIWKKTDPFGRAYYGVSHFWSLDDSIEKNCDLSWLEWDGNEINIDSEISNDRTQLFIKTVGIMKSWQLQLETQFPEKRFVIFASYDDGSELIKESDLYFGFTLRFWSIREGQGPDENANWD